VSNHAIEEAYFMETESPNKMTKKDKIPRKRAVNNHSKGKPKVPKKDRKSPPQKPLLANATWIATLALILRVTMTRDGTRVWKQPRKKLLLERSDPILKTSSLLKKRRRKEKGERRNPRTF